MLNMAFKMSAIPSEVFVLNDKNHLRAKRANEKKKATQHGLRRKADSACDNDRKDGRERGGDVQSEVAG